MIQTISVGDFPRIGDNPKYQVLRRALHRYDAGEINKEDVEAARRTIIQQAVTEQEKYLDIITDGQVYWNDPISHFFRHCNNIEIGPLEIFFSTNRLYRKPIVNGQISLRDHFLRREYETAKAYAEKPLRVVITGPYTLTKHTETNDFQKTLEEITLALNKELQTLNDLPIDEIQLDEPSFSERQQAWRAAEWQGYSTVIQELTNNVQHRFAFNPYWTNIASEIEYATELPVHTIHYDLTNFPVDVRLLQWPGNVVLGVVNAEKQKPEDEEKIKNIVHLFQGRYPDLQISANTGLRYLTRDKAINKIQLLRRIKTEVRSWENCHYSL